MNDQTALHAVSTVIGGSANNVRAVHSPSAPSCSRSQTTSVSQRVGRLVGRALTFLDSDSEAVRRCLRNASALLQPEGLNAISNDPAANYTFRAGGLARWRAKWMLTYIEANLGSKITVAELAEGLTLSPSHFSKAFKRSFGLSPMAYVINRRVERARS